MQFIFQVVTCGIECIKLEEIWFHHDNNSYDGVYFGRMIKNHSLAQGTIFRDECLGVVRARVDEIVSGLP